MVSGLMFKSLIHFVFIFVYAVRKQSSFILLPGVVQFSQCQLLKKLFSALHIGSFLVNCLYKRGLSTFSLFYSIVLCVCF